MWLFHFIWESKITWNSAIWIEDWYAALKINFLFLLYFCNANEAKKNIWNFISLRVKRKIPITQYNPLNCYTEQIILSSGVKGRKMYHNVIPQNMNRRFYWIFMYTIHFNNLSNKRSAWVRMNKGYRFNQWFIFQLRY